MFYANVGSSTNPDASRAGAEAAASAKQTLNNVKIAFLYSGVQYDQKELIKAASAELRGVPVIGNTVFTGVITPEGFVSSGDGFVGILCLGGDDLDLGVSGSPKGGQDARGIGRAVAKEALAAAGRPTEGKIIPPDFFYMAASSGEEEFYLKGIEDIIGRVPLFGGSAADNAIAGEWSVFTDKFTTGDGMAAAFFWTNEPKAFTNKFTGAYAETDKFGVITKVRNRRELVEIDGVPALKKYAEWRGITDESLLKGGNLLSTTITNPLGVKDRLGDLTAIRHPMNGLDDDAMAIGANLAEKTTVIMMSATVDDLIASAGDTVSALLKKHGRKPAALHLVHCGGRRAGIGDRIDEVSDGIKAAAGDIPFIVVFTFGEYGFEDDGNNTTGGLMLSFTALG